MTKDQTTEWNYRYTERLGIMAGADDPTEEQKAIARKEADEAVEKIQWTD